MVFMADTEEKPLSEQWKEGYDLGYEKAREEEAERVKKLKEILPDVTFGNTSIHKDLNKIFGEFDSPQKDVRNAEAEGNHNPQEHRKRRSCHDSLSMPEGNHSQVSCNKESEIPFRPDTSQICECGHSKWKHTHVMPYKLDKCLKLKCSCKKFKAKTRPRLMCACGKCHEKPKKKGCGKIIPECGEPCGGSLDINEMDEDGNWKFMPVFCKDYPKCEVNK